MIFGLNETELISKTPSIGSFWQRVWKPNTLRTLIWADRFIIHLRASLMRPIFAPQAMRLSSPILSFCTTLFHALWLSATVQAYIPATPTNDTQDAIQNGLNVTDVSTLNMLWYGNGCVMSLFRYFLFTSSAAYRETYSYSIGVSYELVGTMSNGVSQVRYIHSTILLSLRWAHRVRSCISASRTSRTTPVSISASRQAVEGSLLTTPTISHHSLDSPRFL